MTQLTTQQNKTIPNTTPIIPPSNNLDSKTICAIPKKPTAKLLYELRKSGKGLTYIGH